MRGERTERAPRASSSLPYKVDTSRPSLRTNLTRLVHMLVRFRLVAVALAEWQAAEAAGGEAAQRALLRALLREALV